MILLCGIPTETPLLLVSKQLDKLGIPHIVFNQRHYELMDMNFSISGKRVTGWLQLAGRGYKLENIRGVYTRLMNDQFLPGMEKEAPDSTKRLHCRALHDTMMQWAEIAPIRVVNRVAPMGSNFSKPYQAQLIRKQGFAVPETLITNDPGLVREFYGRYKRIVYKSISGVRSIVQSVTEKALKRLHHIRWCPTQFQEFVEGDNVRVHTIGENVFATIIKTEATDYRYAHKQGGQDVDLQEYKISEELAEKCLGLAHDLDLPFAGIDLKITPDNQVYCFEVNPSPAFSYYESHTGQPIAEAVARYLAGA